MAKGKERIREVNNNNDKSGGGIGMVLWLSGSALQLPVRVDNTNLDTTVVGLTKR